MKRFIVIFSKVLPWLNLVVGFVYILLNPPMNDWGGGYNRVLALFMLVGVLLASVILIAFSYVVEAACKYLERN